MGTERGELASTQDKESFDERVGDRRTEYAEPQIVRPFVDRLISLGVLPAPAQYSVRWPQIRNLTDKERADLAAKYAEINQRNGDIVITTDEIRDRALELEPLSEIENLDDELERRREREERQKAAGEPPGEEPEAAGRLRRKKNAGPAWLAVGAPNAHSTRLER